MAVNDRRIDPPGPEPDSLVARDAVAIPEASIPGPEHSRCGSGWTRSVLHCYLVVHDPVLDESRSGRMPLTHELPPLPEDCQAILIAGATATGKSSLARHYAKQTGGIIVNADALQVYSCWRLLTDRPTEAEVAEYDHALYGHVDYEEPYSVGQWLEDLAGVQDQNPGRVLICTGGTGLYLSTLVRGLAPIPPIDEGARKAAAAHGVEAMRDDLAIHDPETAAGIDLANPVRVQRAWEVLQSTGRGLAAWQERSSEPIVDRKRALAVVMECETERLADRIATRLAAMVTGGVLEECRSLQSRWDPDRQAARALGARAFMGHLDGMLSLEDALAQAGLATRQYAKRQRTWFRNQMQDWVRIRSGLA